MKDLNTKKNKNKMIPSNVPFVSVCTPTFNRRPFIPYMIQCFQQQDYPKDRIEWIIIDDGTDPIEDLIKDIPQIKYFYYKERMLLGKKRNLMHSKCKGDVIVYMDDDDYYPKERISHAVDILTKNPNYLIAGSSEMHVYFDHNKTMVQFGPYKENHSTAASFAFKKELLLQTKYDDNSIISEEKSFLKNYSIPLIQLDVKKTILVFSHSHNSLDKKKLLDSPHSKYKLSHLLVEDFIKDEKLKIFYTRTMNSLLENYELGRPEHKPIILEKIKDMEMERIKKIEDYNKLMEIYKKNKEKDKQETQSTNETQKLDEMKNHYETIISQKTCVINELLKKVKELQKENEMLKKNTIVCNT